MDDDAAFGGDAATDAVAVAIVPGVSTPPTGKLNVGALAIHPEGKHVYFGATNASHIGVLDIQGDTLVPGTGNGVLPVTAVTTSACFASTSALVRYRSPYTAT